MIRRLLQVLGLIKPSKTSLKKQNPYILIWYRKGWSENKVKKNNSKYWEWEMIHSGFKP